MDWLNELIYRAESGVAVPTEFDVREVGDSAIRARIRSAPVEQSPALVKAATLHGVRVEPVAGVATIEAGGSLPAADPAQVSSRAKHGGRDQLGSIGAGNHFVEVEEVEEVFDPAAAARFGLRRGQLAVLIHTGSRGLGHQVCTDYVREMDQAMPRYGIVLPDRQLACAPIESPEGRAYLAAMCAAANFA